jgi:hypothetical protein
MLLFGLLLVQVGVNAVGKRLASDIGGVKRLHSLVTLIEGIYLFPWMVIILVTQVCMNIMLCILHVCQTLGNAQHRRGVMRKAVFPGVISCIIIERSSSKCNLHKLENQ